MNELTVTVKLKFSDGIDQKQAAVIGENVMEALLSQIDGRGLVGDDSESYTTNIEVETPIIVTPTPYSSIRRQTWDSQTNKVKTL